jgi:hypothetical protein
MFRTIYSSKYFPLILLPTQYCNILNVRNFESHAQISDVFEIWQVAFIIMCRTLSCVLSSFRCVCCKFTGWEVYIYLAQVARRKLEICVLCTDEVKQALTVHRYRTDGVVNRFSRKHHLQLRGNKDRTTKGKHVARIITQMSKFIPKIRTVKMTWPWAFIHTLKARWNTTLSDRLRLKCDGTSAKTRFRLSAKRMMPFKWAEASVQSTTDSRVVRISGSNVGYNMFRGSVKITGYPLHPLVSPSLPLPCFTLCHHI